MNERLAASGPTIEHILWQMLEEMALDEREILTLYYGQDIELEQADLLAAQIQERYPEQEIEVVEGNQPHYHYIISAE